MGMTMAEKIVAAHAGKERVAPGEFVNAKVDLCMVNDISGPIAIQEFHKLGVAKVFDTQKVVLVADHFVPNKDIKAAEQVKMLKEFAEEQGVIYFEQGKGGIEHALIPERGMVVPGDLYIGGDSHTVTLGALGALATGMGSTDVAVVMATGEAWVKVPPSIKFVYHGKMNKWLRGKDLILYTIGQIGVDGALYASMEFHGEAIRGLFMEARFTMCNMAVEAGAKAGIVPVDGVTLEYVHARSTKPYTVQNPDPDAKYVAIYEFDVSKLEPQIAFPYLPSNAKPLSQVGNVKIDQVFIGSCTNGRIEDLREAAMIMKGRKVAHGVRCIVIPASNEVFLKSLREGLIETFVEAGAVVSTPNCGPCLGGHMGVLAEGERCVSTSNRNFVGRMGHPKSEVYLASPAVAAASAILGRIGSPEEVLS